MSKSFDDIISKAGSGKLQKLSVAVAQDDAVLEAVKVAKERGIADAILVGDEAQIREIAASINLNLDDFQIVNEPDVNAAALKAVELVHNKEADILLKGYLEYETAGQIRAVILNGITGRTYEKLAPVLEQWLRENGHAVRLAGYLPKMADAELKSRHLGLILPEEVEALQEKLDLLAEQAEETLDLELLLQIAEEAPDLETGEQEAGEEEGTEKPKLRIAAAKETRSPATRSEL